MSLEAWGDEPWGAEDEPDIERLLGKGYRSAEDMSRAMHDVVDERLRQRDVEGWTPEHDDAYKRGEMVLAAVSYGTNAAVRLRMMADGYPPAKIDELSARADVPRSWPWDRKWWKPAGGTRRILVKAAALLIAEIERMDRQHEREVAGHGE